MSSALALRRSFVTSSLYESIMTALLVITQVSSSIIVSFAGCLAEARFGIPQEFSLAVVGFEIRLGHIHGILLLLAQFIAIVQSPLWIIATGKLLETFS